VSRVQVARRESLTAPPRAEPAVPSAHGSGDPVGRAEALIVGAVLLAALLVRVWRLDLAQVQFDESDAASIAMAWRLDGLFPLAGTVSSVGLTFPPAWPYVVALGLLIDPTPYGLLGVGIVWGLLTVAVCWWVARRWLGRWGGVGALVFYAGGFFPVLMGRSAWQPAFLPLVTLLALDALLTLAVRRRPWALPVACGWLALLLQFHFAAAMYVLLAPVAMWPARRVLRPRHVVASLLAVVLALLPFVIYELHPDIRFRDLTGIVAAPSSNATPVVDLAVVNYLRNLSSNAGALGLANPSVDGLRPLLGRWSSGALLGSLLVLGGAVASVVWWPRGWRAGLLVGWLVLPQVVLLRHSLDVLLHYFYMDVPVLALLAGNLLAAAARLRGSRLAAMPVAPGRLRASRLPAVAVLAGLAVYVGASLGTVFVLLEYAQTNDVHKGYGVPLRDSLAAGRAARSLLPPGAPLLLAGHHFEAEILRFTIGYDVPATVFDDCVDLPYVPGGVYVLLSQDTPANTLLPAAGAPLLARVPRAGDAYVIYAAPPTPPATASLASVPQAQSQECQDRRVWGHAT
jgi:hypothetical protein